MANITFSPAYVAAVTNRLTAVPASSTTYNTTTYLFYATGQISGGAPGQFPATMYFKEAGGTTLASCSISDLTRTQDVNGYVAYSNFPEITPVVAGAIDYIQISIATFTYYVNFYASTTSSAPYTLTFTVGDTGSGADVEMANRDLVTNQPWRLDGSIRFRVPTSYSYSS